MAQLYKPGVVWLTGLSASGKTTIANELSTQLKRKQIVPVLLDGDEIRGIIKDIGFDEISRKKYNLTMGYLSAMFERQGNIVIVSLISPYDDIRNEIRKLCNNFIEVYVCTDLQTCIARDPKGLYKKALQGILNEFTGISAPYFPPANPEISIDTTTKSIDDSVKEILDYYLNL